MQTIYLDISNKGVIPCIQAKQSEVGRKFLAVITDNGVPYNIPNDSLLSVWYEGDTDAGNYSSIEEKSAFSIDGNKVTVELVAQMLFQPGNGELCLSITHGDGGETNTWNIPYEVEYKPGDGSAVPTEYYTALTDAGARAAEQVGLATEQAQIAKQYAEDAKEAAKNSAPDGYGLGAAVVTYPIIEDANTAIYCGWYRVHSSTLNGVGYVGLMRVDGYSSANCVQTVYQFNRIDYCPTMRRVCLNNNWGEWEWINPPMARGVEYRTTERSEGKPVYVKRISVTESDISALGSGVNRYINHGISGFGRLVKCHAVMDSAYPLPHVSYRGSGNPSIISINNVNTTNIAITAINIERPAPSFTFDIYYCKYQGGSI